MTEEIVKEVKFKDGRCQSCNKETKMTNKGAMATHVKSCGNKEYKRTHHDLQSMWSNYNIKAKEAAPSTTNKNNDDINKRSIPHSNGDISEITINASSTNNSSTNKFGPFEHPDLGNIVECTNESCNAYGCNVCRKTYINNKENLCDTCCIKRDINKIVAILNDVYGDKYAPINHSIAEYSYGYIIICCNKELQCKNEIIINNVWELEMISAVKVHSTRNYCNGYGYRVLGSTRNTVNIYEEKWRMFCGDCVEYTAMTRCDICRKFESNLKCHTAQLKDDMNEYYDKIISICEEHSVCIICEKLTIPYHVITCYYCQCVFCYDCGFIKEGICRDCCILQEYELIHYAIYEILYKRNIITDMNIIDLLADYSRGYVVMCCNFDKCETEICIENKLEFYDNYRQQKNVKYSLYFIDEMNNFSDIYDIHWYIYNKIIRIFCKVCLVKHCKKCRYSWCDNMDVISNKTAICRNHLYPHCSECGTYWGYIRRCDECVDVRCCKKCYYIHLKYHQRKDRLAEVQEYEYGLGKYDNHRVFRKVCKPYSLI